jgi:hypothetical protein
MGDMLYGLKKHIEKIKSVTMGDFPAREKQRTTVGLCNAALELIAEIEKLAEAQNGV